MCATTPTQHVFILIDADLSLVPLNLGTITQHPTFCHAALRGKNKGVLSIPMCTQIHARMLFREKHFLSMDMAQPDRRESRGSGGSWALSTTTGTDLTQPMEVVTQDK